MRRLSVLIGALLAAVLLTGVPGCSKNKTTDNNNNPPGNQKEFASGDIMPGGSYEHTFNTARNINYYCAYHGGPGLQGMSGTINVTATGSAQVRNVSITASTLPNISVPVGSTIRWTNNHTLVHTVQSDD